MKKIVAVLTCLMMVLTLFSCRANDQTGEDPVTTNDPPPVSNEIAMQMYEAAIKGEICVVDERLGEIKLEDCCFPSNHLRLGECEILGKAILDMDGDGINEYIIQSETKDHIVLRYHHGKVYSYCFDSSHFYNLNIDGSFYWSDSYESENWSRGLGRMVFDGSSCSIKEIYRIKHKTPLDFYENLEFYVDGKQITSREFSDYNRSNHRKAATFTPLDISCAYPISSERACELASDYWGFESGMSEGAAGTRIVHRIVVLEKPDGDTSCYRIGWQMEGYRNHVPDSYYSLPPESVITHQELFVDAITGACGEEPHVEQVYYHIEQIDLNTTRYSIYDFLGNEVLTAETDKPLNISMRGKWAVDVEIGMGSGISTHRYYHALHNFFSEEYTYVVAATERLVAYMDGPLDDRRLVVRDPFDQSVFYKEFVLESTGDDHWPIDHAEFSGSETHLTLTYAPGQTQILSIRDEYERVLKIYRGVINLCQDYLDERDGKTDFADRFGLINENEKEIFKRLFSSSYLFYPGRGADDRSSPYYKLYCGYAIKDLNGDGVDELVILNADYVVGAIFSIVDGKPVLLRNYQPRDRGWIDANGWIHENGSNGADYSINALYKLVNAKGGPSMELIAEFGTNGHEWIDGEGVTKYYKVVNGEKVDITEVEYDTLEAQYGQYLSASAGAERTKNESELVFTPLFTQDDVDAELQDALTPEDALRIASEYWGVEDGATDGACGTTLVSRIVLTETPSANFTYYHIVWRIEYWRNCSEEELEGDRLYHVEDCKGVFINLYTGNCYDDPLISSDYGK